METIKKNQENIPKNFIIQEDLLQKAFEFVKRPLKLSKKFKHRRSRTASHIKKFFTKKTDTNEDDIEIRPKRISDVPKLQFEEENGNSDNNSFWNSQRSHLLINPNIIECKERFSSNNIFSENPYPSRNSLNLLKIEDNLSKFSKSFRDWRNRETDSTESQFDRNFDIIQKIGGGNFGVVYKCQNKFDKLLYAVKIMKKKKLQGLNEAQALASLNVLYGSNYIVRYFNSWEENGSVFIVMESCNENVLSHCQQKIQLSEEEVRKIINHMALALEKLHADNIVHLDIKPENILLSNSGNFKLSDLGLIKALYDRNDINTLREGDSRYMAKELLQDFDGKEVMNKSAELIKCDIFSLGLTIYKIMMGNDYKLPLNGDLWQKLRNDQIPHLEKLNNFSNSLKRLVLQMLRADPSKRPTASEIVKKTGDLKSQKISELKNKILELEAKISLLKEKNL